MNHAIATLLSNDDESGLERFQLLQERLLSLGWRDALADSSAALTRRQSVAVLMKSFSEQLFDVRATAHVELQRAASDIKADVDAILQVGPDEPVLFTVGEWI